MKKFNESLLKKSLPAIIIMALSVPAAFFLSYNLIKAHAKNAALRDIAVIAELHKGQVCQFLEMTRRRAQDFASDGFIRTQLLKEIRGSEVSFNNLSKYLVENKITIDESIKTIHVLSMEGRVVASTDNAEIGKDLSNKTFFVKGKDAIALVENPAGHEGMPELAVSAPIFSMSKKKAIGVLVNTIRLSELNKILSGEYHEERHSILPDKGRWKGMEVYLVNKNKRIITNSVSVHPLPLNSVKEPTPSPSQEGNTKSPLLGGDLGVGELLPNSIFVKDAVLKQTVITLPVVTGLTTKKEVSGFYEDYRGIVVAGASKPIPQLEWILLTEIDENEILSFTRLMLMSAPIPAGIIIIVGIVFFITFSKTERMKAENTLEEQSCLTALGADIGVALIQHGKLRDILQKCAEALVKNLDVAFARIWTFNKEKNMLELQSSAGIYTHIDGQHSRIPVGMFKVGLIAQERKPILTNSVIGDPRVPNQEWARQTGMNSFAGYPLIIEDHLIGVMAMFAQKPLTKITLKALAAVSDSIALGIERKRVEENLLTVKNRLEFLFKVSPVMIYSSQYDDYRFTFMSENVSLQLGHYAQEFIDNPRFWIDRVHPEDLPHILDKLSHLAEVDTMALEYRFLHKDGTYRSMYNELNLVRDTVGNPQEIIGYWADVTEKRCMEDERKALIEQLYHSQKLESVGTLAGGIAHDFNNILAIIIGYGNLLEKSFGKDNPSRIYIQKILKSAERATNLVQGLLAFSRKQESCPKPVSISRILLTVNNLLLRLIGENIILDIVPPNKDCVVMADCGQMEQVLLNLATNARDAMPNGGKLIIRADIMELGNEFIRTHGYGEIGAYVRISVTDTGTGMDKETLRRIFQPFFTTKEVGKGTGLGLSIVYGIIKQHRGYINVESEPGKGATFRIYLPVITKSTVEEEKSTPLPVPAYLSGTDTILLAEDEEDVRNLAKSLLEDAGYKVIAAVNGYDTINKFMGNKDTINLLLLDVIMPTKNGQEAYEEIRKIRPGIKALFMSGYSESVIHQKTILKEGLYYISKPFSQTMLLKKVREILDNSIVSI